MTYQRIRLFCGPSEDYAIFAGDEIERAALCRNWLETIWDNPPAEETASLEELKGATPAYLAALRVARDEATGHVPSEEPFRSMRLAFHRMADLYFPMDLKLLDMPMSRFEFINGRKRVYAILPTHDHTAIHATLNGWLHGQQLEENRGVHHMSEPTEDYMLALCRGRAHVEGWMHTMPDRTLLERLYRAAKKDFFQDVAALPDTKQ